MGTWELMRQDDNGVEYPMGSHASRAGALARLLVFESGVPHKQTYWVAGPAEPVLRTNRDLYLHLLRLGQDLRAASWSLSGYLRGLWRAAGPLADRDELSPDDVAALFSAAQLVPPVPYNGAWTVTDFTLPRGEPSSHADWERVVLSQIAYLEDFVTAPPGPRARFGADAPRPPGSGRRATPARWCNFDPATYLECAVAGSVGGWDAGDGAREPRAGGPARSPVRDLAPFGWGDLCRMLACGQLYE
ncbi:hypothetical protein [Actinomadura parmotrematis]|uniref:Uncharacterized protein n=1 Tax=Actinomadura parmotrematis TaxID=2864039 RepID=A0ABS7G3K9_9ACTN|nr:hypothetical protein [Actinomadura parmotrematis]MBW8487126.1 hypothetical protein [Actinomadura parmotrematis]